MIEFDATLQRRDFRLDARFSAAKGVTALFGPSGSGKSTIIRMIAGLERPDRGRIRIGDTVVLDRERGIELPPHRRSIGLVFQDALLFPHLSVTSNLRYGTLFRRGAGTSLDFGSVVEVLGIGHLLKRAPDTLSGGERQRVAIGRALLSNPKLLLMDEPLASLDAARKHEILPFIERLRDEFSIPIVYVSHAREEVMRLAAHVVRLDQGRVTGIGTPEDMLATPRDHETGNRFEALSILAANPGRTLPDYGLTLLEHPAGTLVVPGLVERPGRVRVAIRATQVSLARREPLETSVRTVLRGRISALKVDDSPFAMVEMELPGGDRLLASITRLAAKELGLQPGEEILALVKAVAIDEAGLPAS